MSGVIDRDPQNLPVPLGGMAPVRVPHRRHRRLPGGQVSAAFATVGTVAAAVGVGLLLAPAPVTVSLFADRLAVGGMVLREVGSGTAGTLRHYEGDASYVLAEPGDGTVSAAAAWSSADRYSSGVCTLRHDGARLVEQCTYSGGAGQLTSVDVLDPAVGSEWQRTYSDGAHVTIAVAADGGAVPVPFPIGR